MKWRLEHHRPLNPPLEGIQQQYGINTNLLERIIKYWTNGYNWREREKYFNKFPQFLINVQGLDIHFLHVKPKSIPKNVKVLPLLLLHGWPGSVREFYEILPILTTPQKDSTIVFEVIVPHIPGEFINCFQVTLICKWKCFYLNIRFHSYFKCKLFYIQIKVEIKLLIRRRKTLQRMPHTTKSGTNII